jgi:hypothetical protein
MIKIITGVLLGLTCTYALASANTMQGQSSMPYSRTKKQKKI